MAESPSNLVARAGRGRLSVQRDPWPPGRPARVEFGKEVVSPGRPYERIYDAARRIPCGRVATYGQIARLAGMPGHARQVGYALNALPDGSDVPWHRVINASGRISPRAEPVSETIQRGLLEQEGVEFSLLGRVNLARYGWQRRVPTGRREGIVSRKAAPRRKRAK